MKLRIAGLAAGLVAILTLGAPAASLSVGDPAPKLMFSKTIKGEKVETLDPSKPYVVEFWATWCPPCRTSIPHLTELQHAYKEKGLRIIGVSVFERAPKGVEPFVEKMGDKMDYTVAMDDVPEGKTGGDGKMAEAWMKASESEGIPTAFIVREGKIAWIGHPMQMDGVLALAMADNFEMKTFLAEAEKQKAAQEKQMVAAKESEEKVMAVVQKLQKLGPNASPKAQLALIDEAIAIKPESEKDFGFSKYAVMLQAGDAQASAYGNKLVEGLAGDNAEILNAIAWANVDPDSKLEKSKRDVKLALKAAGKAVALTKGENGAILDTLAVATFESGDPAKAVELEEKALANLGDDNAAAKDELKARIETYKKAAKDKAKP